jgi:hypothetical protein
MALYGNCFGLQSNCTHQSIPGLPNYSCQQVTHQKCLFASTTMGDRLVTLFGFSREDIKNGFSLPDYLDSVLS